MIILGIQILKMLATYTSSTLENVIAVTIIEVYLVKKHNDLSLGTKW